MIRPRSSRPVAFAELLRRTFAFICCAALLMSSRVPSADAAGINFSWDDCGAAGSQLKTFACNTNAGPAFNAVASFVPPAGINNLLGMSAEVRVASTSLPDWWKHGSGQCRGVSALTPDFAFSPVACTDFWPGSEVGGLLYTISAYGPNTAKVLVQCAIPSNEAAPVSAAQEYYAFKLRVLSSNTTGAGSCAGCSAPVSLKLQSIQLFQPLSSANDPIITTPLTRNTVYWQAVTPGPPVIGSISPAAGAPGVVVTINGSNLLGTTSVRFGTVAAAFNIVSNAQVTTTVPVGGETGPITLDTAFGSGTSLSFTVAPAIRHFLPKQASAGASILVTGRNFANVSAVRFNGTTASFSIDSDSLLLAVVPGAATTGPISITNPGGTTPSDSVFRVGPAAGALDLSWDDCGLAGTAIKTFACDRNTGTPFTLIGSFVPPPGVSQLNGAISDLGVYATTLPDWWKHGSGQCRSSAGLNVNFSSFGGPYSCDNLWLDQINGGGFSYDVGFYGANTARIRISSSSTLNTPVDQNTAYYAFKVNITRNKSYSSGKCDGCETPVRVTLHTIQLTQPAAMGYNPVISIPFHRNSAFWQAEPGPLPRVDSFTPLAGAPGIPVTIQGQYFTGATAVRFRDVSASFTVDSDTRISTTVPAAARTGSIAVTTSRGTAASESLFVVKPDIRFFLPHTAPVGHTVVIRGTNFTRSTSVRFNGLASSYTTHSDTTIYAIVPVGATDGPIAITNPGGTDTSDDPFHVGPIVSGTINLSWNDCGLAGTATQAFACDLNTGSAFTLVGSFIPPPDVLELTGLAAEIRIASTGDLPDWWKHGPGQCRGTTGLTTNFDFRSGPTSCTDILQGLATGSSSYGVGFYGANSARLQISCSLPASAGAASPSTEYYAFKAQIQRANTTGAAACAGCSLPVGLTLNQIQLFQSAELGYDPILTTPAARVVALWQAAPGPVPQISAFTPPGGGPAQVVTISGSGFTGASSVRFHTLAASSFTVTSDTKVEAVVPAGARTGPIHLATIQGSDTSDSMFIAAPELRNFLPQSAPVGYPLSIRGFNFTRTTAVSFNGTTATFTVQNDSTLQAPVPAGATDGPITVTNIGGSDTSDSLFHVGPLPAGLLNLSWDLCGTAGTALKTFACDANTGTGFTFVGSFVPPPGVQELIGMSARVRIASSQALPDWWKHGFAQCRASSALPATFSFAGSPCFDPWQGQAVGNTSYSVAYDGPNTALLQVVCAMDPSNRTATQSDREYNAFKVQVLRTATTGAGACSGCNVPVSLTLEQLQLMQSPELGFDPVITTPQLRNAIAWQAEPGPPPVIDSFSPMAGAPGQPVTIRGAHFTGTNSVLFHTLSASFSVTSDTTIATSVPPGARTGRITVATIQGSDVSDDLFSVAPIITSFAPRQAPVGHVITVRGVNFINVNDVEFNGLDATFTIVNDSMLTAPVPAGTTSGPLRVANPAGEDISDIAFTVGPLPPGFINLSWDACGAAGADLKNFACNVNTGTVTAFASFKPPVGVTEMIGLSGDIRIASGSALPEWWKHGSSFCRGTGDLTSNFDFSLAPGSCVNPWQELVTGTLDYTVGFGGANMARIEVFGFMNSHRVALDPAVEYHAFKVNLLRTQSTGTGSCSGCNVPVSLTLRQIQLFQTPEFKYDPVITTALDHKTIAWQGVPGPLPDVQSFTPGAGAPGTVVTIRGLHFTATSLVTFDLRPALFTTVSDSVIHATVPAGARTGFIEVSTPNGSMTSAGTFIVAPRIASFSPRQAPVGSTITITGENFLYTSSVRFNGLPTPFSISSDVRITATVPTGATNGPISVTNPGGTAVSDSTFRVGPLMITNGGINLSWSDCGTAGTENMTFACDANSGSAFAMIASFIPPPNVTEFAGMSAQIDIRSNTATLPDWWRHGSQQCRSTTGLATSFDFTSGPFTCVDYFAGQAAGGYAYDVGFGSPSRARFRIQAAVPIESAAPVDPETEYYAFKANILRSKTTGSGSCAGCSEPMCLLLNEIQLFQPFQLNYDPQLTMPINRNYISWQGGIANCVSSTPVQASVVTTEANSERVRVVWMTADVPEAAVYRREGAREWTHVARLVPDGSHRLTFDDYDVVPGAQYAYRLGIMLASGEVFVGETSVSVPGNTALAMSAVRWDAGSRGVLVSLALPRAGAATFEIYDLGGRRFVREALEGLSAGTHDVRIAGARSLKPGMYFARLSQGTERVTGRFVVVQ